jgi:hypothetical protein
MELTYDIISMTGIIMMLIAYFIGIDIDETMTNSKKIHAKNTIRCKLTIM